MKKFAMIFVTLFAVNVMAHDEEATSLVSINVGGFFTNVETAVLRDNGKLEVVTSALIAGEGEVVATHGQFVLASKQLAPKVYRDLKSRISTLSRAKITERFPQIVCMMIAPPGPVSDLSVRKDFDYQTGTATGDMKVVLTQPGCWRMYHAFPATPHAMNAAHYLKGSVMSLARQMLHDRDAEFAAE